VRVHHNFSYQSCGFFEMSSMAGSSKGTFSDSEFYNNVSIDSGWLMLLQVNNTNTANVRWEQNTVVHRKATAINPGMLVTVFTGYSSGTSGGALTPNTVFLTNNYFVLDGFGSTDYINALDSALVIENSPIIKSPTQNAGFVNVAGDKASDFDLVAGSLAIDQGGSATTRTTDFLNRTMPAGSALDIGAFEYGASLGAGVTAPVAAELAVNGCAPAATTGGASATGGAGSTGGARATGGSSAKATGGAPAAAGAPGTGGALASGGALPNATGGAALGQGGAAPSAGGAPDAVGGAAPSGQGGVEANAGGVPPIAQVGDTGGTNAGPAPGSSLPVSNTAEKVAVDQSACSCRVQGQSSPTSLAGLLALLMLSMRPRRNRRLA
jgi:MYXO-CTERM domain-containing protein